MENVIEIWKPVVGLEDYYMVSSIGRVRSLDREVNDRRGSRLIKGVILRTSKTRGDYECVSLYKDGKKRTKTIHRLVCEAFIPNPNNLPEVNHKDENKNNNSVSNLEWCTSEYNLNYGTRSKRSGEKHRKPIIQFAKDGVLIRKWECATEAGAELNINPSLIISCCKNRKHNKSAGNYIWRYYDHETYLIALLNRNIKKGAA